jgi:hypothetical protein
VKERIFIVGIRNWIRNFLLVKENPDQNSDPDPKLGQKWVSNLDPDAKKNSFGSTLLLDKKFRKTMFSDLNRKLL